MFNIEISPKTMEKVKSLTESLAPWKYPLVRAHQIYSLTILAPENLTLSPLKSNFLHSPTKRILKQQLPIQHNPPTRLISGHVRIQHKIRSFSALRFSSATFNHHSVTWATFHDALTDMITKHRPGQATPKPPRSQAGQYVGWP